MADLQPSVATATFGKPFAEQVAFFRGKLGNLVPTRWWDDLSKAEHDRAFMVAGATKADLLADLASAVDRAIAEGTTIEQFRQDFRAIVARHGWSGWTGEDTAAGQAWRTRTIYVTNTRTSYQAGRLAQLREGNFPLWVYRHNDSVQHPRPLHVSWNGITLPPDDPFWQTHYTPNGWGCECYVVGARSPAGARRLGGDPDKGLPDGWDDIDPKTGEPPGVDKGWGYMPGNTVSDTVRDVVAKAPQWPAPLTKAFMDDMPVPQRDALAVAYRALPSVADDARRFAQRVAQGDTDIAPRTLGPLTQAQAELVRQRAGVSAAGYDFALDSGVLNSAVHVAAAASDTNAPRADAADYAKLPQLLNAPDGLQVVTGTGAPGPVVQIWKSIDGQRLVTWWRVQARQRSLALQRFWIEQVAKQGSTP